MKNKNNEEIIVSMDEDANYCIIVGTDDKGEAEKALREQEEEWYGKNHEEKPISIEDFYTADIFYGEKNGEPFFYWGHEPIKQFDEGKFEAVEGFIASLY